MKSTSEKFWNKTARKYAKDPIKDMAGYEKTLADTKKYLGADKCVLEFGCGTGMTALKLATYTKEYTATDISTEMITIANERKAAEKADNLHFVKGTLDDASLKKGAYDVILGYNIIHLLDDTNAALKRIHALLKPGGVFISKTPCLREKSWFWPIAAPIVAAVLGVGTIKSFTVAQLEEIIISQGFHIIDRHLYSSTMSRPFWVAKKSSI